MGNKGGGDDVAVTVAAMATVVAAAANKGGGAWRRWVVDLIDRDTGSHFGVRRKHSPENFFGGGKGDMGNKGGGDDVAVTVAAMATAVAAVANKGGGAWRRWVVDLIDRDTGSHFGVRRKTFSAAGGRKWWWLAGGR
nr:hypothetical protein [Tanacetum cinerariifolium]